MFNSQASLGQINQHINSQASLGNGNFMNQTGHLPINQIGQKNSKFKLKKNSQTNRGAFNNGSDQRRPQIQKNNYVSGQTQGQFPVTMKN